MRGWTWGGGDLGAGVIPKFVVFYRFYSIFMYLNAITGYQEYLIDVLSKFGYIYNESDVDFTSPTRSVPPTAVYIEFVYVRFRFISSWLLPFDSKSSQNSRCRCSKKKKKKKKDRNTSRSNMNFLIGVPNTEYTRCPVGWWGEAKVSCNWYWLVAGQGLLSLQQVKVEGWFYFFCFFTFIHFPFSHVPLFHLLYYLLSLFSLSLGDDTTWPTRVDASLNPNSVKSITCCQVTKHGPFTDLRTNKNSVSVVRE